MTAVQDGGLVGRTSVATRSYAPGAEAERNVNDSDSYLFVLPRARGAIALWDERGDVLHDGLVAPGSLRVVRPGEVSTMTAVSPFTAVMVTIRASACRSATDSQSLRRLHRSPVLAPRRALNSLGRVLADKPAATGRAHELVVAGLATALLGFAVSDGSASRHPRDGGFTTEQLRQTLAVARQRVTTNLSRREWAAAVGLPAPEFARRFQTHFGVAPYEWFLDRRVEHAASLLRDTDMLVGDVAAASGFSSQSHFTDAFRKRRGIAPGRWRDQQAQTSA